MITLDTPKQKNRSLKTLQESALPRLDWKELFKIEGEPLSDEDVKAITEYFAHFLKPAPDTGCVRCGKKQSGGNNIMDQFLNQRFTWGLANGEGFCSNCKYPARAYHREVGPITFMNMILQYHPDELSEHGKSVPNGSKRSDADGASLPESSSAIREAKSGEEQTSLETDAPSGNFEHVLQKTQDGCASLIGEQVMIPACDGTDRGELAQVLNIRVTCALSEPDGTYASWMGGTRGTVDVAIEDLLPSVLNGTDNHLADQVSQNPLLAQEKKEEKP